MDQVTLKKHLTYKEGQTYGYIVVKNNDSYVKVSFYEDSYNDGYIQDIKTVTPRSIQKVIYD